VYESSIDTDNAAARRLVGPVIDVLGQGRTGLVVDVDGTISPIVARPEDAFVLPKARQALIGLRRRLAVLGIVTGRSVDDARSLVKLDGLTYIGNHGLEVWRDGHAETLPEALPWVPVVARVLDEVAAKLDPGLKVGVIFEDKGATASLHYRLAPDPAQVRRQLLEILAGCASTGLQVEEGRRVINLLPPLHINKGSAVTWIVREHGLGGIVYLGDDITDAHAFRALNSLREAGGMRTLSVGVVGPETPAIVRHSADVRVPSVDAVADLLGAVLDGLDGLDGLEASDTMNTRAPSVGSK